MIFFKQRCIYARGKKLQQETSIGENLPKNQSPSLIDRLQRLGGDFFGTLGSLVGTYGAGGSFGTSHWSGAKPPWQEGADVADVVVWVICEKPS